MKWPIVFIFRRVPAFMMSSMWGCSNRFTVSLRWRPPACLTWIMAVHCLLRAVLCVVGYTVVLGKY
ncbi:hypothetical protein E2562_006699 [Oryza meyeriana var. granulata]|uniref:Uncharacterized protein n=1 Tax=Oryza meyeriana var. granulata TaxID=110450 RepID=A0A6G1EGC3_9ORYZ|nr:hypothetical protein E2562_006699 [Oryza meyeriana var. granulata]